jgi:hypothetical protein
MAGKALAMIMPMMIVRTAVQNRLANGRRSVKGTAPRIENQMISRGRTGLPDARRSAIPGAWRDRNKNSSICETCTDTENFPIRKNVY